MWNRNLKYENICHLKCSSPNIWGVVEMTVFNSSQNFIQILPAACLNRNWFYCKSFVCTWLCSTSPQINIKSETGQKAVSKYSIWNNCTGRKWLLWWKSGMNLKFPDLVKDSCIVTWLCDLKWCVCSNICDPCRLHLAPRMPSLVYRLHETDLRWLMKLVFGLDEV